MGITFTSALAAAGLLTVCVAMAVPAAAGLDPTTKCTALKLAAAGKKAAAALKCNAVALKKGTALDAACVAGADVAFTAAFAKAEKNVTCAEPGDAATIGGLVDSFVGDVVAALPPGVDGARCASSKLSASGKKAASLLKSVSKNTKKPDETKFIAGFTKAQGKFAKSFAKAESKPPCQTTGDAASIRLAIDDLVETVVGVEPPACPPQILWGNEGNRLRRYDLDTIDGGPLVEEIFIENADLDPVHGRDVNGQICHFPDGSGRFVLGEDTGQPSPPPGWGVFDASGTQIGKLTATYYPVQGDPYGCAFDADGHLFTSEIGEPQFGASNGQLIMWFPPYDVFPGDPAPFPNDSPSTNFCKIASDIGTAGAVAVDELGRVYVASSRGPYVLRFSPPFPTGPDALGGCGGVDSLGSPVADSVQREVFIADTVNVGTPSGIVRAPNGNWYVSSVLTGVIAEYDPDGTFVRRVLEPPPGEESLPLSTGHPQGMAVACQGALYYADLALIATGGSEIDAGPNGTVRRITFDLAGNGRDPDLIRDGLQFPDAAAVTDGDLENP